MSDQPATAAEWVAADLAGAVVYRCMGCGVRVGEDHEPDCEEVACHCDGDEWCWRCSPVHDQPTTAAQHVHYEDDPDACTESCLAGITPDSARAVRRD